MTKSAAEVEQATLELRGRIAALVRDFEAANGVIVTEAELRRVRIRTLGRLSGEAVLECTVAYVPDSTSTKTPGLVEAVLLMKVAAEGGSPEAANFIEYIDRAEGDHMNLLAAAQAGEVQAIERLTEAAELYLAKVIDATWPTDRTTSA